MRLFPRIPKPPAVDVSSAEGTRVTPGSPRPLSNALTASARRLTREQMRASRGQGPTAQQAWQDDAWDAYDQVGEHRFIVTTLANRLSQARFFVGQAEGDGTDRPEPVEDERLHKIFRDFQGSPAAFRQTLKRMSENLSVAGDVWLVGIPRALIPEDKRAYFVGNPDAEPTGIAVEGVFVEDLEWRVFSVSEISRTHRGELVLQMGGSDDERLTIPVENTWAIRIWDPHPRRGWEASSPARSSLPVLRELIGLTKMVSAQIDSRLAGAGLLVMSQRISQALRERFAEDFEDEDDDQEASPVMDALIEYMTTPIDDRDSAAAVVPLILEIPDGVETPQHITFDSPIDERALSLREEAIRRFALSQDAPPELLLGQGGMNHWGAWLVQDDVVASHLEPPLALICDAITTQYLRPVMEAYGFSPEVIAKTVIWYDVSHLVVRPNAGADARELHSRGVLSDEAVRVASGFDESDAPIAEDESALDLALKMVQNAPSLMADPGLVPLMQAIAEARAIERGEAPAGDISTVTVGPVGAPREENEGGGIPDTQDDPADPGPPGFTLKPPAAPDIVTERQNGEAIRVGYREGPQ